MKKSSILLIAVLIIALAGCQAKAPVNQAAKNGNGTPAVNVQGDNLPASTPAPTEEATLPTEEATLSTDNSEYSASGDVPEYSTSVDVPIYSGKIIEIKEKMFVAQTNEIYVNSADYLGKKVKYEGIFGSYTWEENGVTYYTVIRYGPGCCGSDADCGFEVKWTNGQTEYPNQDDWVECEGILEEYEEDDYKYLRLSLTSLTVLDTRGAEYVTQ